MQIQQITSKENAKLKAAAKLVHSKKERVNTGSFLAGRLPAVHRRAEQRQKAAARLCHRAAVGAGGLSETAGGLSRKLPDYRTAGS